MPNRNDYSAPSRSQPKTHQRNADKLIRIPIKAETSVRRLPKPPWIRAQLPLGRKISEIKKALRENNLFSVCEEAACPNLGECFSHGTATFMILGDICTRRCPFCDVAHGRPQPVDPQEPEHLAIAIKAMKLRYVVVTSVDRDDLRDGGASHFADCIREIRRNNPGIRVEILVPDFRARTDIAINRLLEQPPDVFNHNLETVPRLYKQARPGADYGNSLKLLKRFGAACSNVPTKSGLMLGLGELIDEVKRVIEDLRNQGCTMLTLGQYLQPSRDHLPVIRYVTPGEFDDLALFAESLGFAQVASAPLVRSSYHADLQAEGVISG